MVSMILDTEVVSRIDSYEPGYIEKDLETIAGCKQMNLWTGSETSRWSESGDESLWRVVGEN